MPKPRQGKLFDELPRAPRIWRMHVNDAGDGCCQFKCRRCGHDSGWIKWEWPVNENHVGKARRGIPCPNCNSEKTESQ